MLTITSLNFGLFSLVVLGVYYLLPRRPQNTWLLLASYTFLITWARRFAALAAIMTLFNFFLARQVEKSTEHRRRWLWIGIAGNVAILAWFKSADFFVPQMLVLLERFGIHTSIGPLLILLPLGLSFYTFQAISYLIDVYQKQMPATTDVIDFALYMAYFPKIVAGPIERARTFLPKLGQPRVVDNNAIARSSTLIVIGLFRKVVIADPLLAMIPDQAFSKPLQFAAPELVFFLVAYGLSLYNDFAGYTSIVRGVSGLFGIELVPNFNAPYFARNMTEFWNRWHMSLSYWCRDYIFFPLTRALLRRNPSRANLVNIIVPPIVTMFVIGLWHASAGALIIVLWGILHGVYQVVERLLSIGKPVVPPDKQPRWRQIVATLTTFVLVALAWVPFHNSADLNGTLLYWWGLLRWDHLAVPDLRIAIVVVVALLLDWIQVRAKDEVIFVRWPLLARASLLAVVILVIALTLQADTGAPFVYQGF